MSGRIRMASASQAGTRTRNEDALAFGSARNGCYAVLADGAGGHRRGAEAARRAVECIERLLRDDAVAFSPANLTQMVRLAHSELLHHQDSDETHSRMHSTIVVLWIAPTLGHVLWTHVGDSRLVRLRGGRVDVVTADDSVVHQMLQAGLITVAQSRTHPQKNQLLAALGTEGEIEPHTVVRPVQLLDGDAFLLSSDGWWEGFDEQALVTSLRQALSPEDWIAAMQEQVAARAEPRQDNYSAIAVWVGEPALGGSAHADDTQPRWVASDPGAGN